VVVPVETSLDRRWPVLVCWAVANRPIQDYELVSHAARVMAGLACTSAAAHVVIDFVSRSSHSSLSPTEWQWQ